MGRAIHKKKNMIKDTCNSSGLTVSLKRKRSPRFKAGSDLATKVSSHLAIDYNEVIEEDSELLEINLVLKSENCSEDLSCPN